MITSLTPHATARRIVGLTGGIGMGKSTVSSYLETTCRIPILDADLLARDAVAPDSPILQAIIERYGSGMLHADGYLNRARLSDIVFSQPSERQWLDRQIHPYVRDRFETTLAAPEYQTAPIVVLAVPLLFEARMTDLVTEIWVVYCRPEQQIERLLQRSLQTSDAANSASYQPSREQIQARIDAQMDIQQKLKRADVVLDNSDTLEALFRGIDGAIANR